MDAADVQAWVRQPDVNLEVANGTEEVRRVEVPALVLRHVWRAGHNAQANEAGGR